MREMQQDIHKVADWIEKVTREGIAIERKVYSPETSDTSGKGRPSVPPRKKR